MECPLPLFQLVKSSKFTMNNLKIQLMKNFTASIIMLFFTLISIAQGNPNDYYYEIPEAPKAYTVGATAARVVDGLGFRYYWGTEGLRPEDLLFRASDSGRNVIETINHIHGLTQVLLNAVNKRPHTPKDLEGLSYDEKRSLTLQNIQQASDILKFAGAADLEEFDMIFSEERKYPFWNLLNGPIADAIHHNGQIITMRRMNENPIYSKMSVLQGKVFKD